MGKLLRHHKSRSHLILVVLFILVNLSNAGLLVKRSIRMVREVYPPDIEPEIEGNQAQVCIVGETVYDVDEIVPAEEPCLKCRCQPPGVQCETVQCVKKPGCKAIHRPNRCCPDYQCECEHNGKIYGNGEKLETNPGGECKVCYCRGGEVQCAEVSCYIRKDCEGKRVPGMCCPKYDHCPPIDSLPEKPVYITQASPVTPKSIIDLIDSINLINSTHPPMTTTSYSIIDENKVPDTDSEDQITPKPNFDEIPKADGMLPRITIQEIIPEQKEIPITAPPRPNELQGTLLIEEAVSPSERMDHLTIPDADSDSSEIAEVFQHPPPVLRIGDKLLFLKKEELVPEKDIASTPESVITIFGAEGLQRGFEESFENQDGRSGNIYTNAADTNELELKTAESTHIISFVKRKEKSQINTTTEKPVETTELSNSTTEVISPTVESTQGLKPNTSEITSTPLTTSTEHFLLKNTEPVAEQNPAYPPIPDIMPAVGDVSQKFEVELESDNETMKILPGVFELLGNSTQQNLTSHSDWLKTNRTVNDVLRNETLLNYNVTLPDELLNARSPIDPTEINTTEISESITLIITTEGTNYTTNKTSTDLEETAETVKIDEIATKEQVVNKFSDSDKVESNSKVSKENSAEPTKAPLEKDVLVKSVESIEVEESGEQTTPKPNHSAIVTTDENASVQNEKDQNEASDMTQNVSKDSHEILTQTDSGIVEATTKSLLSDVEMLVPVDNISTEKKESPIPMIPISGSDVEIFTPVIPIKEIAEKNFTIPEELDTKVEGLPKPTQVTKVESSTYELLPRPEHASATLIKKRDTGLNLGFDDALIEVFPKPKVVDPVKINKKQEEQSKRKAKEDPEEAEAQEVFKELLDELSTEDTIRQQRSRNGQDAFDGLTGALTSIALGGGRETKKSNNGGVLGFIGNIFSPNRGK